MHMVKVVIHLFLCCIILERQFHGIHCLNGSLTAHSLRTFKYEYQASKEQFSLWPDTHT